MDSRFFYIYLIGDLGKVYSPMSNFPYRKNQDSRTDKKKVAELFEFLEKTLHKNFPIYSNQNHFSVTFLPIQDMNLSINAEKGYT